MDKKTDTQAPLSGIRVIDFGHYIAGPLTGMLLADQGAEVIKIDRPGPPAYDTPANAVFNRGKKRLQLDLKQQADLATARDLVASADVVIENFRPGVMDRLGLGPKDLTAQNPGLIYLSLPGFASTDSEKASIRAFEGIISAATGLFTDIKARNTDPIYTPIPLGSTYGAIHGAIAVILALYSREETGHGDVIEVPLTGAAMSAMIVILFGAEDPPLRYRTRRHPTMYGSYQTGDDKWIFIIARGHTRNTRSLLQAMGLYDELIAEGMVDVPLYENMDLEHNIPDSTHLSKDWTDKIQQRLEAAFLKQPAEYWVEKINAAGVPCSVHRTTQEWMHTPEAEAAGFTVVVDDPDYGPMRQFGIQTALSTTPDEYLQPKPAREINDIAEILKNRQSQEKATKGAPKKHILEGLRVLDFSNVLAGPACARTLAEYGADVIKIDTPDPFFGPMVFSWFPMEVSPGKRSMILDRKQKDGLKIYRELVKNTDVIVHNFRIGVPERLGVSYEQTKQINPDIVYVNMTALGGPKPGPWMTYPGFDPMVQASTGIQMRYGGEGNPPVLHGWASCIDYITGYSGTLGAVLALFQRKRNGGGGDFAQTSLAQGAQLVQAPFMYSSQKASSGDEPQGPEATGEHALHRIYRAKDGWLFLGGTKSDLANLTGVPGLSETPVQGNERERAQFLEAQIEKQPVDFWVRAFRDKGLGCHRIDTLDDIQAAYLHEVTSELEGEWDDGRSISVVRTVDHPTGSAVDTGPPVYARFKHAKLKLGKPYPKQGSDTREILQELGYSDPQIQEWISQGVVKDSFHPDYLPG